MTRTAPWLILALGTGAAAFYGALWATPRVLMHVAMERLGEAGGVNTLFHAPPSTHESRTVVRPSPDLAYSICVFDLSKGPIRLIADYPEGVYWSVSAYAANTDNFFVANDQTTNGPPARFVFDIKPLGNEVTVSPTAKGVILLRHHIPDPAMVPTINARRANGACQSPVRN